MKETQERCDYYVYVYENPADGCPFYIGKGRGCRDKSHAYPKSNNPPFLKNKLRKLARLGYKPKIRRLVTGLSEQESFAYERFFVAALGLRVNKSGCLCNMSYGGVGVLGFRHTPDARAKISAWGKAHDEHLEHAKEVLRQSGPRAKSGYKGVAFMPISGRWTARLGGRIELGTYETAEEAAAAYNLGVEKYRGGNGFKNKVSEIEPQKITRAVVDAMTAEKHRTRKSQNKTGFKGVYLVAGYYRPKIVVNGNLLHLGTFCTAAEAALAYNTAVDKYRNGKGYKNPITQADLDNIARSKKNRVHGNRTNCGRAKSGYKGVRWNKARSKWETAIVVDGKIRHVGRYCSSAEAAVAYNAAVDKYFPGTNAYKNPIPVDALPCPASTSLQHTPKRRPPAARSRHS